MADAHLSVSTAPGRPVQKVLVCQKAVVTGANSGIGRAVAIALGQAGADVVVNYDGLPRLLDGRLTWTITI